ncbi:V-type ATP synthase subunit I [Chloroflexota bacterium]
MIPLLVNTPEPMVKLRVVTVKDNSEQTLKVLHRFGVLHIEESSELEPVDKAALDEERREVSELLTFVDKVLGYLPQKEPVTLDEDVEVIYTRPFSEISGEVRTLYNKTDKLHERIDRLNDESLHLTELSKYLEPVASRIDLSLKDLRFSGDYLFSRVFILSNEAYENLHAELEKQLTENVVAAVDDEVVFHAVAEVKDLESIEALITGAGGRILEIPDEDMALREFLEATTGKLGSLEEEVKKLLEELQIVVGDDFKRLVLLREALAAESERLQVLEKASQAKYVTLIEGWAPEPVVEPAIAKIREEIDYAFIDAREPEDEEEPPTKYRNPGGFQPFQIIVNLFATPKYKEWDPTPIVTYSFAFFFGLMICDVLYAIGLMLLGKFLLSKFTDDPQSDNFKLFQRLLYTCGGVALIGGLLTGQYFGNIVTFIDPDLNLALVPSVQEALQDPISFIVIALGIGFIHVNIAHIIAFVKAVKERNKGLIIGKVGLCILQFGLPSILSSLLGVEIPGFTPEIYSILSYFLIAGIVLIVISSIMVSGGLGAIMWLFDVTGLLGDVMSYARLAGVGLATYYLAFTFNLIAQLFTEMMGSGIGIIIGIILAVVIVIFGHAINLVLTAITGFMHSLRLCFVEFLFKFYEGGGTEYSPFKLRKRVTIPVTMKS